MTVQDPPWRQRTRPCPFFSQGRCLFADSCNFLHDIKVKSPLDQSFVDVYVAQPVQPRVFLPPKTVFNPPSVVVNSASPRSSQLVSPVDDTSRYFGLLSVLEDVIGPTAHEGGETLTPRPVNTNDIFLQNSPADTTMAGLSPDTSLTVISTLAEESDLCDTRDSSVIEAPQDLGEIQEVLARHDNDLDDYKEAGGILPSYVVDDEDGAGEHEQDPDEAGEDRSQSISMTVLQFPTPPSRFSSMSTASSVLSLLARPHDSTEEPMDNSGQEVYNNLLSPVELSARLRPFSMYSCYFPPKREDSIDSGYADSWTGPELLARSPPHSTRNSFGFDSTPFRRASVSLLQDRRVSYDVRGVRPSPRQPVVAEEHHDDTSSSTLSVLDAYDFSSDLDEELLSPTVRLTGMVLTPPLSPPPEPSFPKQPPVLVSESVPIHDSALEASSPQPNSTPEDSAGHAVSDADSSLESLVSPLSPSTARSSSIKGIFPSLEAVPVGMKFGSLPPSPLHEPVASDVVQIIGSADDVITPFSVSPYVNDSEFMEGELSSKVSLLSLGPFTSGRSSPNTSIPSVECDYTVDDMTPETVFSQPPSPRQSGLAPAQSPTSSPVWDDVMDGYGLQEDQRYASHSVEGQESSIARPGEQPKIKISRELLAHIGHVFSLSDDIPVPEGDALDTAGSGSDVQTDDHPDSWHDALNADVRQALRMPSASPVVFLSDDADFDHDEAGMRTSWSPQLGDLRCWSGAENDLSVEEDVSVSSVELGESDALRGQPSTEDLLDGPVSLPAALEAPAGQAIGTRDIDAFLLQGNQDIQTAHLHDQSLVDTSTVNDPWAATLGSVNAPSIVEFVQRSRAISDATVKPDSWSPSAHCFPPSPVTIPATLIDTNLDEHVDFPQALDDQSVDAQPTGLPSMEATDETLVHDTGESPNLHSASVLESTAHDRAEKHSSVSIGTGFPATHKVPLNLTIRIPSTFEAQPSSSSTAQSLPLILSLSNGRDTKRWFSSHTDGSSSTTNSPSASAPVTSNLPSRETGSTKVPFGFRRVNPQFLARRPLQSVQPPSFVSPVIYPAARRESDATSANAATQQLNFFPPKSPSTDRLLSPVELQQESSTTGLKPLRLSSLLSPRSSVSSSSPIMSNILSDHIFNSSSPHSPNVSSSTSLSHNSLLPSSCSSSIPEHIPEHIHNTLTPAHDSPSFALTPAPSSPVHFVQRECQLRSAPSQKSPSWRLSRYRGSRDFSQPLHSQPRRLSTLSLVYNDEEDDLDECNRTIRRSVSGLPPRSSSVFEAPVHAIATPKPTLLFAIASDDVNEVRQVLESGEAGPNDQVGPQSALAFTLTNDKLSHKNEIVKALLAYGADPSALRNPELNPSAQVSSKESEDVSGSRSQPGETTPEGMDPATRYYVTRADSTHTRQTSQLIYRSFFRPLTRVRYDLIGQDWVLEQLFRVLSMHSQRLSVAPIVVLLCGPSGHGKSLLARKFGSLLDIPTHTVNMTTLRSTHDLWQSYSMSPYEEPSSDTLAQFLLNNEGERCVVVLDEIEKVEDPKALYSLLMPWELGRCSLEVGKRHVDLTKVIWLGTSNIGHDLVFEHHESRPDPSKPVTREEYQALMELSRPHVSQCLGASLLSRVTTVLPFIPFTVEEKMAIAAEAVYSLSSNAGKTLTPQDVEAIVIKVLPSYVPSEGARSLHRAVSNQLVDLV